MIQAQAEALPLVVRGAGFDLEEIQAAAVTESKKFGHFGNFP
jgi:hypothetical protein